MERGERLCQEKGCLLCEEPHSRHDDRGRPCASRLFAVYDTVQAFDETREKTFLTLLKYFLQKRFAEEAGVRTSRRDGLQYADSTAEALYSNEDSITLEDTLEDAGAAAELESVGVQRPCSLRPAGHSGRAGRLARRLPRDRPADSPHKTGSRDAIRHP